MIISWSLKRVWIAEVTLRRINNDCSGITDVLPDNRQGNDVCLG